MIPGTVKIPRSPAVLERIWRAFPFALVRTWTEAGQYPTLEEALIPRETDAPADR